MNKNYILLKFKALGDDDLNIESYMVTTKEYWDEMQSFIIELYGEDIICIFTSDNCCVDYNGAKEFLRNFTAKDISEEEATTLKNVIGSKCFGGPVRISHKLDNIVDLRSYHYLDEGDESKSSEIDNRLEKINELQ